MEAQLDTKCRSCKDTECDKGEKCGGGKKKGKEIVDPDEEEGDDNEDEGDTGDVDDPDSDGDDDSDEDPDGE